MLRLKSIVQLSQCTKNLAFNEINRSNGVFVIARRYISKTKSLFQEIEGVIVEGESSIDKNDPNDKSIVPQHGDAFPKLTSVLVLPVTRRPIFPGFASTIMIKNQQIIDALDKNGDSAQYVGLFLRTDTGTDKSEKHTTDDDTTEPIPTATTSTTKTKSKSHIRSSSSSSSTSASESEVVTSEDQLYKVGTFAQIYSKLKTPLGTQLLLIGHRRINLESISSIGPPCISTITHWGKENKSKELLKSLTIKASVNQVVQLTRELITLNPLAQEHIQQYVSTIDLSDPYKLADFAANITTAGGSELQKVLECVDAEERLSLAVDLLYKERELAKIQKDLTEKVEAKMTKQQREYMLREQMKKIEEELNIKKDDKDDLIDQYEYKLSEFSSRQVNESALKTLQEEINKLSFLDRNSSEFSVTRSYLDWLTHIPWNLFTQDKLNLKKAQKVLDEDHYGMEEVKKRILEFIAVGKLKKSMTSGATGKIICLIGPPGVGKTSIAKSIANALDRKFYRFSVGGLTDMAEIKGHRRTYIGAMPGKPIQCLKSTGYMNPIILIDEIDKLGRGGYNGDPASALLELLDPNQNASFIDHYLDVPTDFSQVLFLCTANDESTIPGPLRDRMEIIRLSGYDITEKVAIATRYLVPKAVKDSGLTDSPHHYHIEITPVCLEELTKNYCRESGVRSLEKHIEKLVRKIAYEIVSKEEQQHEEEEDERDGVVDKKISGSNSTTSTTAANAATIVEIDDDSEVISRMKASKSDTTTVTTSEDKKSKKKQSKKAEKNITATNDDTTTAAINRTSILDDIISTITGDSITKSTEPIHITNPATTSTTDDKSTKDEDEDEEEDEAITNIVIRETDLERYLGKPRFPQETIYDSSKEAALPPGIVMGLAWSPLGGSPIFIETAAIPTAISESGGGVNVVTGQLGSVMKESANIAYTFARCFVNTIAPENLFFKCHQLHLHVPEGAVEKDGPSAGVAMACSFISLSMNTSLVPHLAMTGELSLTGLVLPVGGIKEKILAGRRAGATSVILPHSNRRDYDELPNYVKDSITVHFAKNFSDVFKIAFPSHQHHHNKNSEHSDNGNSGDSDNQVSDKKEHQSIQQ